MELGTIYQVGNLPTSSTLVKLTQIQRNRSSNIPPFLFTIRFPLSSPPPPIFFSKTLKSTPRPVSNPGWSEKKHRSNPEQPFYGKFQFLMGCWGVGVWRENVRGRKVSSVPGDFYGLLCLPFLSCVSSPLPHPPISTPPSPSTHKLPGRFSHSTNQNRSGMGRFLRGRNWGVFLAEGTCMDGKSQRLAEAMSSRGWARWRW